MVENSCQHVWEEHVVLTIKIVRMRCDVSLLHNLRAVKTFRASMYLVEVLLVHNPSPFLIQIIESILATFMM